MSNLDLPDIQGNIDRPYGRYGFPYARYFLFHIADGAPVAGRWFVDQLRRFVTTAEPWANSSTPPGANVRPKPPVTLNVAFTWRGLLALDLPTATLRLMPDEFIDGMPARRDILGDIGASAPAKWDPVWRANATGERRVHILVALHAQRDATRGGDPVSDLQDWTEWLLGLPALEGAGGNIVLLRGHGRDGAGDWQDSAAIMEQRDGGVKVPTAREHFGFTDGISDPVFSGQTVTEDGPQVAIGSGKILPGIADDTKAWAPLAAGEFILGQVSEGQELPAASIPDRFMRNGTFMALRKLHQNTGSFRAYVNAQTQQYQQVAGLESADIARETLLAKMVGRWSSGVPIMLAPTHADQLRVLAEYPLVMSAMTGGKMAPGDVPALKLQEAQFDRMLVDFRYEADPGGTRCPLGAHVRRVNPRDMLDPAPDPAGASSALTNRRRILRRGLPYGEKSDNDADEHGVFIMALCTSLFRQFEFMQQQWLHYGLDFDAGNDTCPIVGNRNQSDKFVIAADPASGRPPFIAANMPLFVETRGGEYYFVPSLTALRMIAMGTIDPT